jgi:hypothetical protein
VLLLKDAADKCDNEDFMCERADGRVYTVRVCATDAAGLEYCDEATAGVPAKHSKSKRPGSQGKLFLHASDAGLLCLPPSDPHGACPVSSGNGAL